MGCSTNITTSNTFTILPITLSSFTAQPKADKVALAWTTATELNNDYMAVERSANGVQFAEIGRVKGLGTTDGPHSYAFSDDAPLPGLNYYRLRQVDFDGAFEYHKVVSVEFDGAGAPALRVFPNPAGNQLQVRWNGDAAQESTLKLLDLSGRQLQQVLAPAGMLHQELSLNGLQSGVYLLQVVQGGQVQSVRVVKQ